MLKTDLERLLRTAKRARDHVLVEYVDCESCPHEGHVAHRLEEVVRCPKCGHRQASEVPRPRVPGEPQAHHYELALQEFSVADRRAAMYVRDLARTIAVLEG